MKRQTVPSLHLTALIVTALIVAGCGGGNGTVGPTNPASGNGNPGGSTPPAPNDPATALFQPLQGVLPYPTDLYFSGSTDGTLNIQPANALMPLQSSVNQLDGFSTNGVIRTRFASPLAASSLTATSVYVAQVVVDSATKATVGFTRKLVLGTDPATADFSVGLATDAGVGNTIVEIKPLKPLVPSAGPTATNVGYLVVLTNGITTSGGTPAVADTDYAAFKTALPTCATITNTSLNGICKLTGAQLQLAAQALQINPANVVLSFSFSTQNTRDTMTVLSSPQITTAQTITVANTGATTAALNAFLPPNSPQFPGHANLYKGIFQIPYYSSRPTQSAPTAPLTSTWLGKASALDPNSKFLTRFNPVPVATETISIPVFVTVPNAASNGHGAKPAGGWPVVIFQHGLTRNRLDAGGIADSFADADMDPSTPAIDGTGYVVVAIDLPLHGLAGATSAALATNPFYDAANERTFNLDLVNNSTRASGPDGIIDGSGIHFVNVPNPLVTRDNLRQAAVDLLALTRSLPNLDLDGDGTGDIDPTRIHFIGHSLGGIVGGVFLGTAGASEVRTSELANPGGGVAQTIFDSPAFGPSIKAGLSAQGIAEGSTIYAQFIRDAQTAVDAGDPSNYIMTAANARPLLVFQVVGGGTLPSGAASPPDQVVVPSATQRLVDAAGLPRIFTPGANAVSRGYVNFLFGEHGSIIDPRASAATTVEMQRESIVFASSLGTTVFIGSSGVVQP
jgi:pimeloyl-ACP methyl ester carboxylesterase